MGALRLAAVLFAVAVVLSGLGWAAQAGPTGPNGTLVHPPAHNGVTVVNISTTNSFTFVPADVQVTSKAVEFIISNVGGTYLHTFTLSNQVNKTAPPSTNSNWPSFFSPADVYADRTVNASQVIYVNVTFGAPGAYQFICRPHYPLGMEGFVYVDESITPAAAPSFAAFWYVVIAVVVLAFLSLVLGVVYGKRGHPEEGVVPAEGTPLTSRVEYYNDSRPYPLDLTEGRDEPDDEEEPAPPAKPGAP